MKNLLYDCASADAAGADSGAQMKDDPRLDADVRRDLHIAGMHRTNLLLVGGARAVRAALDALWRDVDEPVLRWRPGQSFDLPCGGCGSAPRDRRAYANRR